jgi:hypothetical protein
MILCIATHLLYSGKNVVNDFSSIRDSTLNDARLGKASSSRRWMSSHRELTFAAHQRVGSSLALGPISIGLCGFK